MRDASPFLVASIHHSLTHIVEENRVPLGPSRQDVRAAREMREWAVSFLSRFESPAGASAAFPTGMVLEALARTALASQ